MNKHDEVRGILEGRLIKTVRLGDDGIELTLDSTDPAVTLTIRGSFELVHYGSKTSVIPSSKHSFGAGFGYDYCRGLECGKKGVRYFTGRRPILTCEECYEHLATTRVRAEKGAS